ncbi:MAG TPA: hypothetical protein DSN98_08670 [Thermoplasmata archaeon]|jgi:hypothetical protein|nr:MAG TPA: hypothetical protein DSN98_08670 [Thermoplasmata archaeon]
MKTVGYLEGTDPAFLTKLVCMGYKTLPIGNDIDNHGKNIAFITIADKIDLIVGYLHKVSPLPAMTKSLKEFLTPGALYEIPILLLAPKETLPLAKKIVSEATTSTYVKVIDYKNLMDESMKILK